MSKILVITLIIYHSYNSLKLFFLLCFMLTDLYLSIQNMEVGTPGFQYLRSTSAKDIVPVGQITLIFNIRHYLHYSI